MERRSGLWKVALALLFGLLAGIVILRVGFPPPAGKTAVRVALSPPAVVQQIRSLSQLVTVKYSIQKAVALEEQKIPVGRERILIFVQAEVAGGIDLTKLAESDVQVFPGDTVAVSLPDAEITSIVIDESNTKVWDRSITWWTPWVPYNQDLERQARLAAREEVKNAALAMGILDQAEANAETAIRGLLTAGGAKEVRFLKAD